MRKIILHDDGSEKSQRVAEALREREIEFTVIPLGSDVPPERRPLLTSNCFVLEGLGEIKNYLLPELDEYYLELRRHQ